MRRLRGPRDHVLVRCDDEGRRLVSRRMATELSGRDPSVIHRAAQPVACDVATRTMLVVYEELLASLPKPRTAGIPAPRAAAE